MWVALMRRSYLKFAWAAPVVAFGVALILLLCIGAVAAALALLWASAAHRTVVRARCRLKERFYARIA
ncbi:hypothetical protein GCM10007886_34630 [Methylobacterium gregans]|uniref:Uncharacterized protein n=1 Tax=Methylobacterium gregans TaxID=374424 RepID=A0AA37HM83_9HYPH|nr:hypothetical protein [Methylobacterium gregans]GJD77728.1 hypothetical protein NBEOAGPD_0936 [Methylobacterium gregans]GLS55279.1 hypothetical protein GCM10007886_34630 [Methylobacterium gregans]